MSEGGINRQNDSSYAKTSGKNDSIYFFSYPRFLRPTCFTFTRQRSVINPSRPCDNMVLCDWVRILIALNNWATYPTHFSKKVEATVLGLTISQRLLAISGFSRGVSHQGQSHFFRTYDLSRIIGHFRIFTGDFSSGAVTFRPSFHPFLLSAIRATHVPVVVFLAYHFLIE